MSDTSRFASEVELVTVNDEVEISDPSVLAAEPLVSVLMITYNHAAYLAEAIESIVCQQCEFPFELIVGEDASSDETRTIAFEYQKKYPAIIRVVYSARNVGMTGNERRILTKARGQYIAYCEGDDYWCDASKLMRQVELIRNDPRIGIVHSDWVRAKFRDERWKFDLRKSVHRRVPSRLLEGDIFSTFHFPKILRTCTVLFRRHAALDCAASMLGAKTYKFGDNVRNAYFASRWRVAYVPAVTAVYRESPNSALRSGAQARVVFYKSCLEFDTDARSYFSDRRGYPRAYRWEASVALLLWSVRARDAESFVFALKDICAHFGPVDFLLTGWRTIIMRKPTLHRQRRDIPHLAGHTADGSPKP